MMKHVLGKPGSGHAPVAAGIEG
ncbi:hypothetical protein BO443_80236 [Burkholderia orbicola]